MRTRGQASVISGLILTGCVIATWTIVLAWGRVQLDYMHRTVYEEIVKGREALEERLLLEDFFYNGSESVIFVKNVGVNLIHIERVFLNETECEILRIVKGSSISSPDVEIRPNEEVLVVLDTSSLTNKPVFIHVRIITSRGVSYYATFKIP